MIALLACSPAPAPEAVDGWDTSSAWEGNDPSLDPAGVGAQIDAVLAAGLPDPDTLLASIDHILSISDPGRCGSDSRTFNFTMGGCETDSGWILGGVMFYEEDAGGFTVTGDAWAIDPDGRRWLGAGDVAFEAPGHFEIAGTWGWAGDVGWTSEQPSLAMVLDVGETVTLDGGYQPGAGAVYFDHVSDEGGLGLRDPAGGWYVVSLHGDCGTVTWGDEVLGETCIALSTATADLVTRMAP